MDFSVKYRGMIREWRGIMDGLALLDGDEQADPSEITHPSYHPTLGLTAAHTAAADTGGVMVAIRPPDSVLRDLVGTGAATEDFGTLHITLAYFESLSSVQDLHRVMRRWTTIVDPITIQLGGWGKFTPPGGDEVLYASIDSPGIEGWRNTLLAICRQEGLQWSERHGFQPHLTCSYGPTIVVPDEPPPSHPVTVNTVVSTEGPAWTTWVVGSHDLGLAAALNDEPEPALPRTDGGEPDEEVDEENDDMSLISRAAKGALQQGAEASRVAKQGLRDFTPMEQRELIDEGQGRARARNLSALDLDGTHYDPASLEEDPEDLGFGW